MRSRIITDASAMQGESGIAKLGRRNTGNANINCHGLHVKTVLGDPVPVTAKVLIAPRGSIPADDINLGIGSSHSKRQIMKQIENPGIVYADVAGAVVAQVVVQFCQGPRIVIVSMAVHDIEALTSVGVKEVQTVAADGWGFYGGGEHLRLGTTEQ